MSGPQFIGNIKGDMEWLKDVHIPDMPLNYWNGSAIVYGNMDSPWRVDLYEGKQPSIYDRPSVYRLKPNGKLRHVRGVLYGAYRIQWSTRPKAWEARFNQKFRLTPAIAGKNKWRVDFSITVKQAEFYPFAIGVYFIVKGHRAKSKEWLHKRKTRVTRLAELLTTMEAY